LCADVQGFSLHAAVRCGANDRQTLEQLCHHITRPALANERMLCNAAGQVVLKRKTPWRFSTTNLVMSRMEFMQQSTLQAPGNDARPRERLLQGDQFRGATVASGSPAGTRLRDRVALNQSVAADRHTESNGRSTQRVPTTPLDPRP